MSEERPKTVKEDPKMCENCRRRSDDWRRLPKKIRRLALNQFPSTQRLEEANVLINKCDLDVKVWHLDGVFR